MVKYIFQGQLTTFQNNNNDMLLQKQNVINKLEKEMKALNFELQREILKCETLSAQNKSLVEERDKIVSNYKIVQQHFSPKSNVVSPILKYLRNSYLILMPYMFIN